MSGVTGSVFFNQRGDKFIAKFGDTEVVLTELDDGSIGIAMGAEKKSYRPKTNDRGTYFICDLPGGPHFVSPGENAKGPYYRARFAEKLAAKAGAAGTASPPPQRPAQYGGRRK